MTPLDIFLLALPADRARAEMVLDGLHEAKVAGVHSTRIEAPAPQTPEWVQVARLARTSRCVLFCWSNATSAPQGAALRELGAELLARKTAVSIELDRGATPPEMAGSTIYPAFGWRCKPGVILRFLFGDIHRAQIAVAAARKVSGQDPPPPAAIWQLIRARGWVAIVGFFALLGTAATVWSLWNDDALERAMDHAVAAEFARARDARDCQAMHTFANKHSGSGWKASVTEFLANCQMRETAVNKQTTQTLPLYAGSQKAAQAEADRLCTLAARNHLGRVVRARVASFEPDGSGSAECDIAYRGSELKEIYVK
ncbi:MULTISPECIES: hypothetical protein [Sphingomonas]|uniref:hypothetical protein n=1 Tax=Sphingomonas TaxID=13687 RepID=UPI00082B2B82|nr:hypothetical protein [Sphingomonas sp. CCH10-B3]